MKPTIDENPEPEGLEDIVIAKDEDVEEVIKIYRGLNWKRLRNETWMNIHETYQQKKIPILIPTQIDLVLQRVIQETPTEQTNHRITGLYITHLIQESYTAGNNNFTLNTKDTTIYALAHNLTGTKKQPIKLTINGNTGNDCGTGMKQSQLTINGNTRDNCGWFMKQSQVTINGDTGNWCGEYSTDSTINTNNKETYEKIKANISKGNTVTLYNAQGNIIERYS